MCSHVFPALYLNLGTEMMYVLDQRLRVQKERIEDREKSDKVVKEIMLGFLAKKTLEEVFKGHGTPTRSGLKMFFEKVAHCSIMRLNENSMDKLFDLMMMSYKFQLMKMTMPEQIMTVTVNHLRSLLDLVKLDKDIGAAVEHAYTMMFSFYRPLGPMGWYMLRNSLLTFFQDTKVKVSQFIRDSRQMADGKFVLFDRSIPVQLMKDGQAVGVTQYFNNGVVTHSTDFYTPYKYKPYDDLPDALDAEKRSTDLGGNTYKEGHVFMLLQGGGLGKTPPVRKEGNEMALFESLMSSTTTSEVAEAEIWGMSMFDTLEDEKSYEKDTSENTPTVVIDASEKKKSLKTALEEMKLEEKRPQTGVKKKKTKGANMLEMMDEAAARPATAKKGAKAKRSESTTGVRAAKPATDENTKPRTRSGSRPTTGARPKTKSEGRPEARPEARPASKKEPRPATKSATRPDSKSQTRPTTGAARPTTATRPVSKSTERAESAKPKRAASAKKKTKVEA